MPDLRIRNVDEVVIQELKDQARRRGTTLGAMVRGVLANEAERPRREVIASLLKHQDEMRQKYGVLSDSTPVIREEREQWS